MNLKGKKTIKYNVPLKYNGKNEHRIAACIF